MIRTAHAIQGWELQRAVEDARLAAELDAIIAGQVWSVSGELRYIPPFTMADLKAACDLISPVVSLQCVGGTVGT